MNPPNLEIYLIVLLLPVAAGLVVFQESPYHTLVLRGILGAIAALIYTVLGAPDVALTEALVGTLLAITLYAVAVRSSLVLRLGVVEGGEKDEMLGLLGALRGVVNRHYLRLEVVPYETVEALQGALREKEIHGWCLWGADFNRPQMTVRIRRIYDILKAGLTEQEIVLNYLDVADPKQQSDKH